MRNNGTATRINPLDVCTKSPRTKSTMKFFFKTTGMKGGEVRMIDDDSYQLFPASALASRIDFFGGSLCFVGYVRSFSIYLFLRNPRCPICFKM